MPGHYSHHDDAKPQHRRSNTPFPSSPYSSTPRTMPDSPSLNDLMADRLFPSLLKQNPDRPLIINLGTLNLSDTTSSGDDASLTSMSTTGGRYTYVDPPRSPSYYYRPSSYSASFTPRERPETYVHYTRPSGARGGAGGLHISPASSRGANSRESSTSYYRESKPREYSSRHGGNLDRTGERGRERAYCEGCCKWQVLDGSGLCEECVFFVPKTAGRGRRDVGGRGRAGLEGVRYVDSEGGEGSWWARKRAEGLGRDGRRGKRGSYSGSVYYGGMYE
ncbi:hypothetical protein QBC39DRAFT_372475 [Podospora conica]|nr:hypothetical protein QBC39DRAFT_372475 [Schizothecium conicum]